MKFFLKSLPYLKPYLGMALLALLLTLAVAALGLAGPWPVSFLVDDVLGKKHVPHWVTGVFHYDGKSNSDQKFYIYAAVLFQLLITIVGGGLNVFSQYILTRLEQRIMLDFRSDLLQRSLSLSIAYHDQRRSGMVIYIINSMGNAPVQLLMKVPSMVFSIATLVGMFVVLLWLDKEIAFTSLAIVPFLYYSVGYYATHIQTRLRTVKNMEGESLAIIHEALSMIRVIFAFGRHDYEYGRFRRQGEEAVDARISVTNWQNIFNLVVSLITAMGYAVALAIGARHVLSGALTVGGLWIILWYINSVYGPLKDISYAIGDLQDQFMNLQIAFELLDTQAQIHDTPGAVEMPRASGHVKFENVDFTYEGRTETLKNISFEARAGDAIAIVGPTGAGKSSLVSLIPRFYDLTGGAIYIDGQNIRGSTLTSLREQIAIVVQEPLLFSGSIKENIRYGRLTATDDEVIEAAKAANAHDFIMALPEQYDTLLGERGAQISGGERQRLSIARAVIKNAPILILDEPTSSVDSKTEQVILEALRKLMVGRTTFMIAHRLSTVRSADLVLVMDKGEIVARGTHDQLLRERGLYAQLHRMQTGEETPVSAVTEPETASVAGILHQPRVVILGSMSRRPTGSGTWATIQYLEGLRRLGYDAYYIEAHGGEPSQSGNGNGHDGGAATAQYLNKTLARFGFADHWACHDFNAGRSFGMSLDSLHDLYRNAALIINFNAATNPLQEHLTTNRLLYLETDSAGPLIDPHDGSEQTRQFLTAHCAWYTWALNSGNADCRLPVFDRFPRKATCPVVVTDFWQGNFVPPSDPASRLAFTTVGEPNHLDLLKFIDVPAAVDQRFEFALAGSDPEQAKLLNDHGWGVQDAADISGDLDSYRRYLSLSRGELTATNDQNVRLRSGWLSERSAQFLAAGRPVIMQETGFSNVLPTGEGLLSFLNQAEALEAIEEVNSDYEKHCRAAARIGRDYFNYDVVLKPIMADMGL